VAFNREHSAGYLVNLLARRFAHALQQRIAPHGVTTGVFPLLLALWDEDGLTQAELVERLALEQPTVANTLNRMERDGLIARQPDPEDLRVARIHLTRRGRDLRAPCVAAAQATNKAALTGFTKAETAALLTLVRRVLANLEADAPARRMARRPRRA
jgi:DNA-binding MarR family transcriptional regulator